MFVKIKKEYWTFDTKYNDGRKGAASVGQHIYYVAKNKLTGEYCAIRCDMKVALDPSLDDFGQHLKVFGSSYSKKKMEELCMEEATKLKAHFNTYVMNSPKAQYLDENGECFDKSKLFYHKCSFSFTDNEIENIRTECIALENKKKKRNKKSKVKELYLDLEDEENKDELELRIKMKMEEIQNTYFCLYYNTIKKQQGIKGRDTTIADLEMLTNWHTHGEDNFHTHALTHSYDPVSKRYMNPRLFSVTKQKVHMLLEKRFKHILEQGVAIGYDKLDGIEGRRNYLKYHIEKEGMRKAIDSYNALQNAVGAIVSNPKLSSDEMKQELLKHNVEVVKVVKAQKAKNGNKKVESNVHLKIIGSNATFSKHSFRNKLIRSQVTSLAERLAQDNDLERYAENLKKGEVSQAFKTNQMEEVIQHQFNLTTQMLEKQLRDVPNEEKTLLKLKAFYVFAEGCRKQGVYVDINKQGHCNYIKMGMNNFKSENNISLTKYKSSSMVNRDLIGKNITSIFDLDADDIEMYRLDHLNHIPKSLQYGRTRAYMKGNLHDINLVEQEHFLMKINTEYLTKKGFSFKTIGDTLFIVDKKDQPLVKVQDIDENTQRITTSNLYPNEAANLLHTLLIEDSKTLGKDEVITITPSAGSEGKVENLRHLQLKLLFSTDKKSKKIVVKYDGMEEDTELQEMIKFEYEKQVKKFHDNFAKNSSKIQKNTYNFTDKSGLAILDNPQLSQHHDRTKEILNDQIIELITQKGVTDIRFNKQDSKDYILANREAIIEQAAHLSNEEKVKLNKYLAEIDTETDEPKTPSNKRKNKNSKGKLRM
nr:hypothetical protein [Moritella viscosa]SHO15584.1 Catalase-peroxidase-Peroxidase/catalase [Moritella viscosa]